MIDTQKRAARQRKWNQANAEKVAIYNRRNQLKNKYGITPEQYDTMLQQQGGKCAVCGEEPEQGKRLSVDHDHVTGMVRALLCTNCNTALGMLEENPSRMRALLKYVGRYEWRRSVFIASKAM